MNNTLVFIRHAKTLVDKKVPIEKWILTEDGSKQSQELGKSDEFNDVDAFISSQEDKSYLTIKPLADRLKKKIIRIENLGEIRRPGSEKITIEEYDEMKVKIFKDLDFTAHGWETANHALKRFRDEVEKIDGMYEHKKILICAHGTVMTLYFAALQNKLDDLFSRWHGLEFGAVGIVRSGKVVKDIV
jgi:broad specificity phosphatase PhoE